MCLSEFKSLFLYLAIVHSGKNGLFVTELKLQVHKGKFVGADLESVIGEENS